MITWWDDQPLSVMSNLHVELYKGMILTQYIDFSQQNQYFFSTNS